MSTATQVKWVLALIGLVLLVIVGLQNREPVTIQVLFWKATIDRLLFFPALFLVGLVLGFALGWGWERKRSRAARSPQP